MSKVRLVAATAALMFAMEHAGAAEGKSPGEKSVADIAEQVKPSLVKVFQVGRQGVGGLGSGFVVRADGLIATNRHVIGEARRIRVETSDGRVEEVTVEKPNPVPMNRWLTIGVLNPRVWKPLMGAQWSQRAGVVNVEQPGDGFGGRSLCLWMAEKPGAQFEAEVTVRLDDEAGAAGLMFCSDGGDRHYGFYPTGGKLRLTRFDGADVFSWKILADSGTDAYRPGEWNTLRVRVDEERIKCFVNDRQVFDQEDRELRGGRPGLCKFRGTNASYKGFRIGGDLVETPLDPALTKALRKSMDGFLARKGDRDRAMESLLQDPALSRRVLAERRKALEQSAASLRDLERDLHRAAVARELARQLSEPDDKADLLRCALLISHHDNPELDIESYLHGFAQMVDELKEDAEIKKGTLPAVQRLKTFLFEQNGFHGSRHDYESRSNSYINEVLDDRDGLPITLSVIYLELASRLGIKCVVGILLPMRFMVGYREKPVDEFSLLDVFDGGKQLSMDEARALVAGDIAVPDETTRPAAKKDIILRMIRNLIGRALASENSAKAAAPYFDLLLTIEPQAFRERVTRARMREVAGNPAGAAEDIDWLLKHPPKELDELQRLVLEEWLGKLRQQH